MSEDENHLRLLSIFHYVVGGLAGVFSLFPVFHLIFGLFFIFSPKSFASHGTPPPALFGWFFVIFALFFIGLGLAMMTVMLLTGRFLGKRRHYLFCLVVAGIECIFMPFGTVLGIFTLIVLMKDPVKKLFETPGQIKSPF